MAINNETVLYMLEETSPFMMSFVIITKNDNAIIVDGGRPEDMPLLKKYVGGRHISAWFLTHAHSDHVSGFFDEVKKNGLSDFDVERVIYKFPPFKEWLKLENVPDLKYFRDDTSEMARRFYEIEDAIKDITHIAVQGEEIEIDECKIKILYTTHEGLYSNPMNDSSLVFMLEGENKKVLFLGDLGPEGGDVLYSESRHLLKCDLVQMAHHGHMNVSMEVYAAASPEACLWCAPDWLYAEPEIPSYLADREKLFRMGRIRMYGTAVTRSWMDKLGVKKNYVTKDGTQRIII